MDRQSASAKEGVLTQPRNGRSLSALRRRLRLLKTLVPVGLVLIVVGYEMGPARWILDSLGAQHHFLVEILVYGTVGPVLTFVMLGFLERWLDARETNELQARVLAQVREQAHLGHQLSDEALQTLFAASLLLGSIGSGPAGWPPEVAEQFGEADRALQQAIRQLQAHLLTASPGRGSEGAQGNRG